MTNTPMTLDGLLEICRGATPGPWTSEGWTPDEPLKGRVLKIADHEPHGHCSGNLVICEMNGGTADPYARLALSASSIGQPEIREVHDQLNAPRPSYTPPSNLAEIQSQLARLLKTPAGEAAQSARDAAAAKRARKNAKRAARSGL